MDLYNASGRTIQIPQGQSVNIEAGLSVKIPEGYWGLIKARSSTFMRKGLFVIEAVIDSGYTGPIYTQVWNPGIVPHSFDDLRVDKEPADDVIGQMFLDSVRTVKPWDRVSQLLILPVSMEVPLEVLELPVTERGVTGFGSTGV